MLIRVNSMTLFFFSFFSFFFFSCTREKSVTDQIIEIIEIEEPLIPSYELTLIAAGDNLFHMPMINTHRTRTHNNEKGYFNFDPIYERIKPLIQTADLAFINQETVMGGTHLEYQSFPTFNTPESLAYTLRDTGFNIINLANNHAMDMGREGLYNTLDLLASIDQFTVIGARKEKEGDNHRIIEKNNITLGFLSYTYGLNGQPLPADNPNAVSLIRRQIIEKEINILRPLCDFLIVSMHWGEEYKLIEPDNFQKNLALFLANLNVDLIIGHHPHVLQRVESLLRSDGKQTLCFYSLGNFVSNQREIDRVLGGLMLVTFTKNQDELFISNYGLIPVITHYETGFVNTKIYPFHAYTEEKLKKHLLYTRDNSMSFDYFKNVLGKLDTKIYYYDPLLYKRLSSH